MKLDRSEELFRAALILSLSRFDSAKDMDLTAEEQVLSWEDICIFLGSALRLAGSLKNNATEELTNA